MGQGESSHWSRSNKNPKHRQMGSQQCQVASFSHDSFSFNCSFIFMLGASPAVNLNTNTSDGLGYSQANWGEINNTRREKAKVWTKPCLLDQVDLLFPVITKKRQKLLTSKGHL